MKTLLVLASPPPPLRLTWGGAVKLNTSKCFIKIDNFQSDNKGKSIFLIV